MKIKHIIIGGIMVVETCMVFATFSFGRDVFINPRDNKCPTTQGTACHIGNAELEITPNSNPHCYTCEGSGSTVKACGADRSISIQQGGACSGNNICHRCDCNTNMQRSGDGIGGPSTICVCKNPETMIYDESSLDCIPCPDGQHPNADKTACIACPENQERKNGQCVVACQGGKIVDPNDAAKCVCPEGTKEENGQCVTSQTPPPSQTSDRDECKPKELAGTHKWNYQKQKCEDCNDEGVCCGTKLNTYVPFIGNCIRMKPSGPTQTTPDGTLEVTPITAFPTLVGALMRILTSAILIIGLLLIIVAGVMMVMEGANTGSYTSGKKLILKVGAALALLGLAGMILKLINPTFFM